LRVGVVTGAGRGIGAAIASRLARDGLTVVVADIDLAAAERQAATLPEALSCEIDVSQPASVRAMVQRALERFDRIDVLVNNAGITGLTLHWRRRRRASSTT